MDILTIVMGCALIFLAVLIGLIVLGKFGL